MQPARSLDAMCLNNFLRMNFLIGQTPSLQGAAVYLLRLTTGCAVSW